MPPRAPSCSTRRSSRSASRPATTAACSARSPRRTSPTPSRRRAASRSTAARSTSTSPSSTSAPTWSSWRWPTASPPTSRRWSASSSADHPPGRAEGLPREAFFVSAGPVRRRVTTPHRRVKKDTVYAGKRRPADPRRCYVRGPLDEHAADHERPPSAAPRPQRRALPRRTRSRPSSPCSGRCCSPIARTTRS